MLPADPVRPIWSSASALVYIGSLVALVATLVLLGLLQDAHGDWALVGYAALAAAVALVLALLLDRAGRAVAAGVGATLGVVFLTLLTASLLNALGALDADVGDYQPATLVVEGVTIAAALGALRRYRTPLLVLPAALAFWVAVADLGSLASWDDAGALLSIVAGVALAAAGVVADRSGRAPYGFWLHAVGGLAAGGGVLALVGGDLGWGLVGLLALGYVLLAYGLGRSSYAVLGAVGILITTTYFVVDPLGLIGGFVPFAPVAESEDGLTGWQIALSYVAAGLVIALLGVLARLRAERPADMQPLND